MSSISIVYYIGFLGGRGKARDGTRTDERTWKATRGAIEWRKEERGMYCMYWASRHLEDLIESRRNTHTQKISRVFCSHFKKLNFFLFPSKQCLSYYFWWNPLPFVGTEKRVVLLKWKNGHRMHNFCHNY